MYTEKSLNLFVGKDLVKEAEGRYSVEVGPGEVKKVLHDGRLLVEGEHYEVKQTRLVFKDTTDCKIGDGNEINIVIGLDE